jgi:IclR family pca regulon transcriptional regulator
MSLPEVAQPHLEQLVEEVEESSEVSILDGEEIVYIVRVPGPKIMTVSINVGARMPAHATSMGRVLLAGLDDPELSTYLATATLKRFLPGTITTSEELRARIVEARDQGWAIIDQELEEGLRAVAAPIRDRQGNVVAAVNLSTHAARHSMESLRDTLLPHLLVAARRIESDLHMAAAAHPRDRRRRDRT